ncbi:MAG: RICIN domain-containing protein [Oscillospiraceae bacterium]|nr:RICIN domain-containing protein [Oscillospiraceae bacterium]
MKKPFRKILSLFLVCVLIVSTLPTMIVEVGAVHQWTWMICGRDPVTELLLSRREHGFDCCDHGFGLHKGIDLDNRHGVPAGAVVCSVAGGTVIERGWSDTLGYFVTIDHGNQVFSMYGHLSSISAPPRWERIEQGWEVGRVGRTGSGSGNHDHLHFEARIGGNSRNNAVNPLDSSRFSWRRCDTPEPIRERPTTSANIPNGVYSIQGRGSGKFISSTMGLNNGAETIIHESSGGNGVVGADQIFRLERQSNNTYKITSVHSGKVLDIQDGSDWLGARIHQWDWHSIDTQRWYIVDVGDGYYKFVSQHSGFVMDVDGGGTENFTAIQQWAWHGGDGQQFKLTLEPTIRIQPATSANISNGTYVIQGRGSGKFVSSTMSLSNGAGAIIHEHGGGNGIWGGDQIFRLERQNDNTYRITSNYSNKVLDIRDGSNGLGARVHQWDWHGTAHQRWYIQEVGGGYYRFVSKQSGLVMDVDGGGTGNFTAIQQWEWHGGNGQQFRLILVCRTCKKEFCECPNCNICEDSGEHCIDCCPNTYCLICLPFTHGSLYLTIENNIIEIHNVAYSTAISTKGLYITDDESDLFKWQMPSFIIRAGEFILINGIEDSLEPVLKRGRTNFDVALTERLLLTDATGNILSEWESQ